MADPRPAYNLADVALGMGGSALRAMAFEKPVIVLGERGFSEVMSPSTEEGFKWHGFYGIGSGVVEPDPLVDQICDLLGDVAARRRLGAYCRRFVCDQVSLTSSATVLEDFYASALEHETDRPVPTSELLRSLSGLVLHKARGRYERFRGEGRADDFNSPALLEWQGAGEARLPQQTPGAQSCARAAKLTSPDRGRQRARLTRDCASEGPTNATNERPKQHQVDEASRSAADEDGFEVAAQPSLAEQPD